MPSQSSGPVTTFLMFVPLVAVPALAIFGIPDLKQVKSLVLHNDGPPILGKSGDADQLLDQSDDDLVSPVRNDIRRLDTTGSYETSARGPSEQRDSAIQPAVDGGAHPDPRPVSNTGADAGNKNDNSWTPPPRVLKEWDPSPAGEQTDVAAKDVSPQNEPGRSEFEEMTAAPAAISADEQPAPLKPLDEFTGEEEPARMAEQPRPADTSNPGRPAGQPHGNRQLSQAHAERDNKPGSERPSHTDRESPKSRTSDERHSAELSPGEDSLTLKTAVKRLNALGVRDFHLQPGAKGDEFHFSCTYAAPDQPRVTRRFEAEAVEPLQAVRKVLAQVEALR